MSLTGAPPSKGACAAHRSEQKSLRVTMVMIELILCVSPSDLSSPQLETRQFEAGFSLIPMDFGIQYPPCTKVAIIECVKQSSEYAIHSNQEN